MDTTPENGSLILLEEAQKMLDGGAPESDIISMILRLEVYNIKRANAEAEKIRRLQKHDLVQLATDHPRFSIPIGIAYLALVIPEARNWLWDWLMNSLGIK
ncbi:MAG TPA: hypothetical protein VJ742_11415 [Nitrososphaera sp.]|nr:hypothetical protein [Nitrososphaera sp.]